MRVKYVDLPGQYLTQREELLPLIDQFLEKGEYIQGQATEEFEKNFAGLCQVQHAFGVANGTDALIIALKALDVGPGDEVVTVSNSWISTGSCIGLVGANPVFIDVDDSFNMDPKLLEAALTDKTKAIIPVHLTGVSCDMDPIMEIARKYKIPVIEDAAQSVGAKYKGRPTGSIGDIACFSLHPLKNLNAVGDAGVMTTNNPELAIKINLLRQHGSLVRNDVQCWGLNSRLDGLQAVVLNHRFPFLQKFIDKRRAHAQIYRKILGQSSEFIKLPQDKEDFYHTYHLFMIQAERRDELKKFLKENEISSAIHYPTPIHLQKPAIELGYKQGDLTETEAQSLKILSLPVHHMLEQEQIEYTAHKILEFYEK